MPGAGQYNPVALSSQLLNLVHGQGIHAHTQFQGDNQIWMWKELLWEVLLGSLPHLCTLDNNMLSRSHWCAFSNKVFYLFITGYLDISRNVSFLFLSCNILQFVSHFLLLLLSFLQYFMACGVNFYTEERSTYRPLKP